MMSDPNDKTSLSAKARSHRIIWLGSLLTSCGISDVTVLDIGGTVEYWKMNSVHIPKGLFKEIDVVNLPPQECRQEQVGDIKLNVYGGDALDEKTLRLTHYDLVHSNSVIEHIGNLRAQKRMADIIKARGEYYWIQTPARNCPLEPHFYFPFFAYLPLWMRAKLHQSFSMGFMSREPDWLKARMACEETRLLTKAELEHIFEDGNILEERLFMLVKSYIATNMGHNGMHRMPDGRR